MNQKYNNINVLIGIDFGTKRIGVAVGQTVTLSAKPLTTIPAKDGIPVWETLTKLIKKWQPDAIIVGVPLNIDGTTQKMSFLAQDFIVMLKEKYQIQVFEMDERLTTKDARDKLFNKGGFRALQKGMVDAVAAQLILQTWINENFK